MHASLYEDTLMETQTCTHAYIDTCIHTYLHTYIHTYIHTHMHACMHACMHAYIHTYMHTWGVYTARPSSQTVRGTPGPARSKLTSQVDQKLTTVQGKLQKVHSWRLPEGWQSWSQSWPPSCSKVNFQSSATVDKSSGKVKKSWLFEVASRLTKLGPKLLQS